MNGFKKVFIDNKILTYEHLPVRGFQSSMSYKMIIGLGSVDVIDSLEITWPRGRVTKLYDLIPDISLHLNESDAQFNRQLKWMLENQNHCLKKIHCLVQLLCFSICVIILFIQISIRID